MASRLKIKQENDDALPTRRPHKRPRSWFSFLVRLTTRLTAWYAILTVIFFCPSSLDKLTEQSSPVCKPYLHARDIAVPYLEPYYDTYAAHHVEKVRPHFETFRARAYEPGVKHAHKIYTQYAAPRVSQVTAYGQSQWDKVVRPQLDALKDQAAQQYAAKLGPHVSQTFAVVDPYVQQASQLARSQYETMILPGYKRAVPYGQAAYSQGSRFATTVAIPYVKKGSLVVYSFIAKQVWPPIRILYGENVQPQLVKIQERLTSYREGRRIESAMYEGESSLKKTVETTETSATAFTDAVSTALESMTDAIKPKATEPATTQSLKEDLNSWKVKFTKAADRGAEDLQQRVDDIVSNQISSQVDGTGRALLTQLEEASNSALNKLHQQIRSIVDGLPEDVYDEDEKPALEDAHTKIRAAGKQIKDAAQRIRSWKQMFLDETDGLVKDATDSTLDVIDHIRDLGLQDIGMRWTREDDTSYKDWSEYHSLKKTFDKWHGKIENAAYNHKALKEVKQAGEDIEAEGMALAQDTAKELMRLKDVAHWKIRARDASDNFESRVLPPALIRVQEDVQDAVQDAVSTASEAVLGSTQEPSASIASVVAESAAGATEAVASVASEAKEAASEAVFGAADPASSSIGKASAAAVSAASSVVERVKGSATASPAGVKDQVSSALDSVSSVIEEASSSVSSAAGSSKPVTDSIGDVVSQVSASVAASVGEASKSASSVASDASNAAESLTDSARDAAEDTLESASEAASSISSKLKETVGGQKPATPGVSSAAASIAGEASKAASQSSRSLSSAASSVSNEASKASSQASGSVVPNASSAAEAANDFVSDKIDKASASIASAASQAGSDYSSVTEKVAKAASKAASERSDEL